MECLKGCFGREELLVEFYVRELLKLTLVMNSKEGGVTLSSLYDRIETQLRALETLGVATTRTQLCCSRRLNPAYQKKF